MDIQDIIEKLGLSPLSGEGGMFRRTYLSTQVIKKEALSTPYPEDKPAGSAIMYMLTPNCYSRLHRLPTDEVYHFYLGSPVQLLLIPPEAEPFTVTLGQDIMAGMQVQYTVPAYNRETVEKTLQYEGEKDFYASDAAYLSEFEGYVKTYLESQKAEDLEYAKINALWNHLTEKAACVNLPQLELDYYYNAYLEEIKYYYDYYKSYGGTSFTEQYPDLDAFAKSYMGVEADGDWKAELNRLCEDMVKKDMIAHAIAELEGFETVTEEEFKAELKYWVDSYQGYMTEEEILARMGEEVIREGAFSEKVQKWLLERASFTIESAE